MILSMSYMVSKMSEIRGEKKRKKKKNNTYEAEYCMERLGFPQYDLLYLCICVYRL